MTIPVRLTDIGFENGRRRHTVAVNRIPIDGLTVVLDGREPWDRAYTVERDGVVLFQGSSEQKMKAWIREQSWP